VELTRQREYISYLTIIQHSPAPIRSILTESQHAVYSHDTGLSINSLDTFVVNHPQTYQRNNFCTIRSGHNSNIFHETQNASFPTSNKHERFSALQTLPGFGIFKFFRQIAHNVSPLILLCIIYMIDYYQRQNELFLSQPNKWILLAKNYGRKKPRICNSLYVSCHVMQNNGFLLSNEKWTVIIIYH